MAVLWPERCKAIVSVSGYLISSPEGNQVPSPPTADGIWTLLRRRNHWFVWDTKRATCHHQVRPTRKTDRNA
jgi:hypothetical protein